MKNAKSIAYLTLFCFALSLTGARNPGTALREIPQGDSLHAETSVPDSARLDTLREIMVMGDSLRLAPVRDAISQSLGRQTGPHVKSLGEILNDLAPNAMDYVLHPFGFAERKKAKKRKKAAKILDEIDRVTAPSAYSLALDSVLRLEGKK